MTQQAKQHLTVALLQMQSFGLDQDRNLQKGERFCRQASVMGADMALFPEMWNIGYQSYDPEREGAEEAWLVTRSRKMRPCSSAHRVRS